MTQTKEKKERGKTVQSLETDLRNLQKQADEYLSGWQRSKADYKNLRERTDAQRSEVVKAATEELIVSLLPVVDNLELALAATKDKKSELYKGFELIQKQLLGVLASNGVNRISSEGEPFDPEIHEAIGQVPGKEGICVIEHAVGYKIHGKILRPCRVSVGTQSKQTKDKD